MGGRIRRDAGPGMGNAAETMSLRHHKAMAWERKLKELFDRIDGYLEDRYGKQYPLHPARSRRGETASPSADGLFRVGASFSAGYGSKLGPGYVVDVHMVTLSNVPKGVREEIQDEVARKLQKWLPETFPGKTLKVQRDGPVYKIHGDLSLGSA